MGAPFDGRGKVFIYMGSGEFRWTDQKEPDQVN